jgi:hypothetical protein
MNDFVTGNSADFPYITTSSYPPHNVSILSSSQHPLLFITAASFPPYHSSILSSSQ